MMADTAFDPGGFFEFDLARGAVSSRGGERVLILSDDVVAPLIAAAVNNGDLTAVRKLGKHLGEAAAGGIDGEPASKRPELVLGRAADVLSLFGWGRLRVERWGDALVAALEGLPRAGRRSPRRRGAARRALLVAWRTARSRACRCPRPGASCSSIRASRSRSGSGRVAATTSRNRGASRTGGRVSAELRIAKLEGLLERIEKNRRPAPGPIGGVVGAAGAAEAPKPAVPSPLPKPAVPSPSVAKVAPPEPAPRPEPAQPEPAQPEPAQPELEVALDAGEPKAPKPTPMEMALEVELDGVNRVEVDLDEGPEIVIDHDDELEEAIPTAPVETRAPSAPGELAAQELELSAAAPSSPVARAVSKPAPTEVTTFGELLDRTLSLRPR